MNFGNCCIRARKAHTSIRKFSKENLTVKVSGVIVDAHLIPMKFRTEGRQPLQIFYNAVTKICDAFTALLVQRSTSMYFAEHKFDRCQTCFCLIRAASVPPLNVSVPPWMAGKLSSSDVFA
ncbi:anhydro-N-acetylmuramic acid kinase [Treponema medium]|uniref:Anhydro-N-acetylmuramic acid kinase n=1 Tax=Treponema medium TaxID=58231 RepID=A0ABX7LTR2_TREMD|nr:anhydro-N-acetylmuramic acid kinase [Treponema medium]QSH96380.1 anhydro-N-acetylmuramic acid kinase [Treponema medium]